MPLARTLSFLKQAEDGGTLFHTPTDLPNNLDYTIATAQAAKKLGYRFLLDYHYSDTWADPGKQFIPRAWANLTHPQLAQAVFEYTRDTIAKLRDAGVLPEMVQIGNEITNGMMWPDGRLPQNWDNFADLIKAGIAGVEAGKGNQPRPRIMIHIDKDGDKVGTKACQGVFRQAEYSRGLRCDRTELLPVEAAYNWTPGEYTKKPGPFPESPEGQRDFPDELNRMVLSTPNGLGKGVFWWEPAVTGGLARRGMFDDKFSALPVIAVFDRYSRF